MIFDDSRHSLLKEGLKIVRDWIFFKQKINKINQKESDHDQINYAPALLVSLIISFTSNVK